MMVRYAAYFVAALLPLLLFRWFAPVSIGEIDFWLLWLGAMVLVALPMVYAEIALAYRSSAAPVAGMQTLTREADASPLWRSFGWLAALVAIVIAALVISGASLHMLQALGTMQLAPDIMPFALSMGLVVIAVLLSLLGVTPLPIGLGLMLIGMIFGAIQGLPQISFAVTGVSLGEWARAVALALVSVGAGTGLYWFTGTPSRAEGARSLPASKQVLPIWGVQVVVGGVALGMSSLSLPPIAQLLYGVGVVFVAGYLLHYAAQQLAHRFGVVLSMVAVLIIALLLVAAVPDAWLAGILVVVSSIAALLLSVFAGWQMKISHLRKALNFSSEGLYNLWRIAIRLLVPLALIIALIGWGMTWIS